MNRAQGQRRDDLDPVLVEEIRKIIGIVAARFARAWKFLEKDELEAEAWRACLHAAPGFDPAIRPAEAYFRVVARRAMGKFCSRTVAAVSMGKRVAEGAKYQARAELTDWNHGNIDPKYFDRYQHYDENAEASLLDDAEEAEKQAWVERVRELVETVLQRWNDWDRYVVYRLHGLDGYQAETPMQLAERLRVPRQRIYRIHARLEKAIWSEPSLYQLHKER